MKKLLKSLFCICLSAAFLTITACGGNNRQTDWGWADITDDSIPQSYELAFGGGQNVSIAYPDNWYAPASLTNGLAVWKEVENRLDIKIKWSVLPVSQWNTSMSPKINSGRELSDIIGLPYWHNADIDKFAKEKIIIPLNQLINEYAPNIKKLLNAYPEIRKQLTAADGNIYCLAEFFEANEYYNSVLVRKDWLIACGYADGWVPTTVEEYEEVLGKFRDTDLNGTDNSNAIVPLGASGGSDAYEHLATGFGLSAPLQNVAMTDGKAVYQRATPEYGQFLRWLNKLYEDRMLFQDYQTGDDATFETMIARNQVGMTIDSGDKMDKFNKILKMYGIDGEYIMINPPIGPDGTIKLVKRPALGGQFGISYDCKDPITAIRILDYLWASDEGNILIHYGLENITYTVGDDGSLNFTDFVMKNPNGLDPGSALRTMGAWTVFDRQTAEFMQSFLPQQVLDYVAKNIADGVYVEPFPKIIGTPEEVATMNIYGGDLTTYQQEHSLKYILGTDDVEKYESVYIPQLEKMGLRAYEQCRTDQYERYSKL